MSPRFNRRSRLPRPANEPDAGDPPVEPAANLRVRNRRDWRGLTMICLAVAGLVISGYLGWGHLSGSLALCTGVGGCA